MIHVAKIRLPINPAQPGHVQTLKVRYRYHPAHPRESQGDPEAKKVNETEAYIELLSAKDPTGPKPYGETTDELPFLSDAERAQVIEACWKHYFCT